MRFHLEVEVAKAMREGRGNNIGFFDMFRKGFCSVQALGFGKLRDWQLVAKSCCVAGYTRLTFLMQSIGTAPVLPLTTLVIDAESSDNPTH